MRIVMQAHAKINWALNITGRRPNGYHELDMLMQSIELCDVIEFEEASELSLSVDGQPQPECTQNLIIRAAKALGAHAGGSRGARVNVTKWIPERAGLGGGSADCAATLIALNRLWDLRLPFAALRYWRMHRTAAQCAGCAAGAGHAGERPVHAGRV